MKVTVYTIFALIAFAANSVLCRMALAEGYIDPWNFTIIRLLGGALCLSIIIMVHSQQLRRRAADVKQDTTDTRVSTTAILSDKGSWLSSISLVVYALCFSLAYVELDTGTGALILFAAVQFTMIGWGIYQKEQLSSLQWFMLLIALIGFIYLMLPSATTPSLMGAIIMAISGMAWGVYSIRGKACISPLRATGFNFIRSLVTIPLMLLVAFSYMTTITLQGFLLASISGAITSGLGYCLWYVALPLLKSTQAAVVQFCVPILAALAGVVFLSEQLTLRFVLSSVVIISAVLVFVLNKKTPKKLNQVKAT